MARRPREDLIMRRILIIGCSGAGKSTLSARLGRILDLPVIHLDQLYWKPGSTPTPQAQWRPIVQRAIRGERWVMDGNYAGTLDLRIAAADTIVMLDLPRWLCIARITKRVILGQFAPRFDMAEGCPEQVDWEFMDSVWDFNKTERPKTLAIVAKHRGGRRIEILRSDADVEAFVRSLESTPTTPTLAVEQAAPRA